MPTGVNDSVELLSILVMHSTSSRDSVFVHRLLRNPWSNIEMSRGLALIYPSLLIVLFAIFVIVASISK